MNKEITPRISALLRIQRWEREKPHRTWCKRHHIHFDEFIKQCPGCLEELKELINETG